MAEDRRQIEDRRQKTQDNCLSSDLRTPFSGFTLAEILASMVVGTMVLVIVLAIYSRAQVGAAGIKERLESNRLPREVLQRIAEDLDRIAGSGQDTQIRVDNKFLEGFPGARIEILKTITDSQNQAQTLERIVWQSSIEPDTGELALYRSHSGIALEDKLLDDQKKPWQQELFIPICSGITFFRVEIPQGDTVLDSWVNEGLPPSLIITLSFAQPVKMADGTLDVPEEKKFTRTIAIDRTRKPAFTITLPPEANQPADANRPADANQPEQTDSNTTDGQQNPNLQEKPIGQQQLKSIR